MSRSTSAEPGRWKRALGGLLLASSALAGASEGLDQEAEIEPFVQRMVARHSLDAQHLRFVLGQVLVQQGVLDAISRPAEAKPWHAYRRIFLTDERASGGGEFWQEHHAVLERAETEFGVPVPVVVAIIGVETSYGRRTGRLRVLDSLATLAFRYPRRSRFFSSELEHFLLLVQEEGLDPLRVKGSYAGAMGVPQFISSSYRSYAIDFDGDARRDLIGSIDDAVGSVARYLERHGWRRGEAVAFPAVVEPAARRTLVERGMKPHTALADLHGVSIRADWSAFADRLGALIELEGTQGPEHWVVLDNFYAITRYNHSKLYAMAVHQLSEQVRHEFERRSQ